jgi:RNA recognition motif-containing protein
MPSELEDMFKKVGEVKSFTLINEKGTGKFKGIAFVEMSEADAKRAISNIHNAEIKGRRLVVKEANPRAER